MAKQPCVACGDDTAAGSPLYTGRTELEMRDGQPGYLCSDCHVRITGHDRGELTEEDVRRLREGGSAFAFGLSQDH
jgi:hypothetical protein